MSRILSQDATPRQTGAKTSRNARVIKGTGLFSKVVSGAKQASSTAGRVLVKKGQAASFANLPFVDQYGNKIDPADPATFKATAESRAGKRPAKLDPALTREIALTRNKGAAVILPEFKRRAAEHLDKTNDLRSGILSGSLETPGNKSDVLKKKLAETRKKEEPGPDAIWLQEVHSHLVRSKDGDAARLLAQARAMQAKDGEGKGSEKAEQVIDLSGVKTFAPRKLAVDTGATHVVRGPSLPPVDDRSEPQPISFGKAGTDGKSPTALGESRRSRGEGKTQSLGTLPMDRAATIPFQREMNAPPAMEMPSKAAATLHADSDDAARAPHPVGKKPAGSSSKSSGLLSKLRSGLPGSDDSRGHSRPNGSPTMRADDAALRSEALSGHPRGERTTRRPAGYNPGPSLVDGTDETMQMRRGQQEAPPVQSDQFVEGKRTAASRVVAQRTDQPSRGAQPSRGDAKAAGNPVVRTDARTRPTVEGAGKPGRETPPPMAPRGSTAAADRPNAEAPRSGKNAPTNATTPAYRSVSEALEKDAVIPAGQTMGPLKAKTPSTREPLPGYVPEPSTSTRRGRLANRPVDRLAGLRSALRQTTTPDVAPAKDGAPRDNAPVNRVRVRDESSPRPRAASRQDSPRSGASGSTPAQPTAGTRDEVPVTKPSRPGSQGSAPSRPVSSRAMNQPSLQQSGEATKRGISQAATAEPKPSPAPAQPKVMHPAAGSGTGRPQSTATAARRGERPSTVSPQRASAAGEQPVKQADRSALEPTRSREAKPASTTPDPPVSTRRGRAGVKAMTQSGWHVHAPGSTKAAEPPRAPVIETRQQTRTGRASAATAPVRPAAQRIVPQEAATTPARPTPTRNTDAPVSETGRSRGGEATPRPQPTTQQFAAKPSNEAPVASRTPSTPQPVAKPTSEPQVATRTHAPSPQRVSEPVATGRSESRVSHPRPSAPQASATQSAKQTAVTPAREPEMVNRTEPSPQRVSEPVAAGRNESQAQRPVEAQPTKLTPSAPQPVAKPTSEPQVTTRTQPASQRGSEPVATSRSESRVANPQPSAPQPAAKPLAQQPAAVPPSEPQTVNRTQPSPQRASEPTPRAQQTATRVKNPTAQAPRTAQSAGEPVESSRPAKPVETTAQRESSPSQTVPRDQETPPSRRTVPSEPRRSRPTVPEPRTPRAQAQPQDTVAKPDSRVQPVRQDVSGRTAEPGRATVTEAPVGRQPRQTGTTRPVDSRAEAVTSRDVKAEASPSRKPQPARQERSERPSSTDEPTGKTSKPVSAESSGTTAQTAAPATTKPNAAPATTAGTPSPASTAMAGAETASRSLENLQQVLDAVKSRAGIIKTDGTIKAHISLRPEGLGELQLEVVKKNGRYLLRMGAEHVDAARIIERALPQLKEALHAAGIPLDKADVEVGSLKDPNQQADDDGRGLRDRRDGSANNTSRDGRNNRSRGDREGRDGSRFGAEPGDDRRYGGGRRPLSTGTNTVDTVL